MGQIPLHFHLTKSGVIFGSEIKSLLEHPEVPNEIDIHSLDAYLAYKYVPDPQTIYQNIFKLPAAHRLIITQKETKLERYWSPPEEHEPEISKVDVLNRLDALLSDAVRCRMVSDVPLGAFLSGGIDSSLVVAYMAANSARPIQTFTIGFDDATYDERIYAKQVSERFNTVHHEFIVTMDAAKVVPELVAAFDEPFADSSALPVYYLSKLTRQHVTVALNGDGGDESFGGYSRYFSTEKFERYRRLPTMLRSVVGMGARLAANGGLEKNVLVRRLNRWNDLEDKSLGEIYQRSVQMPSSLRESLYRPESLSQLTRGPDQVSKAVDGVRGHDTLNRIMGGDRLTYLPGDLLVKVDRMCMHHHLEGRSPFLDHRVVEFAAGLSSSMKCPKQDAKYLLKRLLEKSFPREFTYRKKMGFGVPLASWFRNSKQLKELVFDQSANCPHIDPKSVAKLYREHSVGSHDHSSALWTIVMLESWYASR